MVLTEESALSKINDMVDNFESMCCSGNRCGRKKSRRLRTEYTNFSMKEILKPDFGKTLPVGCDSDSDGTWNWSESHDNMSSADESIDSQAEIHETEDQPISSKASEYFAEVVPAEWFTRVTCPLKPRDSPFSVFHRLRYHDDGYTSSESSDNESALDLRLERKKTPPKMSGDIPAWVFCTRYSDRPAAGPRSRRRRNATTVKPKRVRTAFNEQQLQLLNIEYEKDKYLSETRRHRLATNLGLNESNLKVWFQNRRAKEKKDEELRPLARRLKADGLYNHKTVVGVDIQDV